MTDTAEFVSIHRMTPKVKQFQLKLIDSSWDFKPGQHTVIHFDRDGKQVNRPYTPTSLPFNSGKEFTLAIKRYGDGNASLYMHNREVGDNIEVEEPHGNLYLRNFDRDVVFVSTGTGITPMVTMLKHYIKEGRGKAYFFYGEKTQENIMYRETLDQLEAENKDLKVYYSLSDEEWKGMEGHIQEYIPKKLERFGEKDFYVCGVPQMVVQTEELLKEKGVEPGRVFTEGWERDAVED
ncbi:MAG: FAD-dependent oxidoreductase [Candidatus Nanohaloarchaeota archaeon QJJ-9]|nr:FAD-dependent oxidoreductase [Candidatus Nanohaloarchaeota archaeon QJJ-9]